MMLMTVKKGGAMMVDASEKKKTTNNHIECNAGLHFKLYLIKLEEKKKCNKDIQKFISNFAQMNEKIHIHLIGREVFFSSFWAFDGVLFGYAWLFCT